MTAQFSVTQAVANSYGTLHGGCTALIIDVAGTLAILSANSKKAGVSVEMNQSFLRPLKLGATVFVKGVVLKMGKTLAFTEVSLHLESAEGLLCSTGRHTKALN
jgi:acyl-coenzyme A thioesterase 13